MVKLKMCMAQLYREALKMATTLDSEILSHSAVPFHGFALNKYI